MIINYDLVNIFHISNYVQNIIACPLKTQFARFFMGRAKRKCVFEHAQNTQIQVHSAHEQSFIRAFALHIDTFCSVQYEWFLTG